jgi:hypothetical protein
MDAIAILDFGTARTKLLLALMDGTQLCFSSHSRDTKFADIKSSADFKSVWSKVEELINIALARGCRTVIPVGTEFFRSSAMKDLVGKELAPRLGNIQILSPRIEALLFYRAVQSAHTPPQPAVSVDVGGGSVQFCWGENEGDWGSAAIGTFSLERRFQTSPPKPLEFDSPPFNDMQAFIRTELASALPTELRATSVVVGSNIMEDFFSAVLRNLKFETANGASPAFSRGKLNSLLQNIVGRDYASLGMLFPQNPGFLYGADKLLMVLHEVVGRLGADTVIPTNESVSKGLGRMALLHPQQLLDLGLSAVPLSKAA